MPIPDYRNFQRSNELYHYGMPRRSGRYPWGSGERPFQGLHWSWDNVKTNLRKFSDKLTGNYGTDKYVDIDGPYEKLSDLKNKIPNSDENLYGALNEIRSDCFFVNNEGNTSQEGRNMNCVYCTVAMAMRQKGYDVIARSSDYGVSTENFLETYFPGSELQDIIPNDKENLSEEEIKELMQLFIEQQEDGSYGMFRFYWADGESGHAVFYQIKDNKMAIYDGQSATTTGDVLDYIKNIELFDQQSFQIARLDNVDPSNEIGKCVVSRK